jgi:class 3 adenylate cyclase
MNIAEKRSFFTGLFIFFILASGAAKENGDFYFNLRDYTIYARTGFDPALINKKPEISDESWKIIPAKERDIYSALRVRELNLPGVPQFKYPRLFGWKVMEFTFLLPFTVNPGQFRYLNENTTMLPALFLAGIGDNWEIYLNGTLIRTEMHLDKNGRITLHKNYRDQCFVITKTLFREGENIITFRIAGDPSMRDTGLFYSAPYYISSYDNILHKNKDYLSIAVVSVFLFIGLYDLFVFLRKRSDAYNLSHALFSTLTGLYYFFSTGVARYLIVNGELITKLEIISLFMAFPCGVIFWETFFLKKVFLVTKIYTVVYFVISAVVSVFSLSFALDMLIIWGMSIIILLPIIIYYDIILVIMKILKERKIKNLNTGASCKITFENLSEKYIIILFIAISLFSASAVLDIYFSSFDDIYINLSLYGSLLIVIISALTMAWKTTEHSKRQERIINRSNKCMNSKLVEYIVVADKDPESLPSVNIDQVIMFTDVRNFTRISEGMSSQTTTEFLLSLNKELAVPIIKYESSGYVAYTDKFMGDSMMNIFENAEVSLRTAVDMRLHLRKYNVNIKKFFPVVPDNFRIDIGTGISCGPVTLGVMGHPRRLDYTPIGDTVNIASRLEGLTKIYHTPILINNALYEKVNTENFVLRHVDKIRVKGKNLPVDIYEEFSTNIPEIRDLKLKLLPEFYELQEMYFSGRNWAEAERLAVSLLERYRDVALRDNLGDKLVDHVPYIYLERMRLISKSPDFFQKWDGVYTFNQ